MLGLDRALFRLPIVTLSVAFCVSAFLSGCATSLTDTSSSPIPIAAPALAGRILGGQQPVVGSTIQLYAAGATGYGSASTALLTTTVKSLANGSFSITGDYSCPSTSAQVYMTATGGNPGLTPASTTNPQLVLMTALGSCGSLTSGQFVQINETTTVAAVWALAPFMTDVTHVGTSATNAVGLANAFTTAAQLVNNASGAVPGTGLPSDATAPIRKVNTIADILAACVNTSGGASGDGTTCGNLMLYATPSGGTAPTDTLAAAVNIAHQPGLNTANLYSLATSTAPFQPIFSTAPYDFSLGIAYAAVTGGGYQPNDIAIDANQNVWLLVSGSSTSVNQGYVAKFDNFGNQLSPAAGWSGNYMYDPSNFAIDQSGNVWIENGCCDTGPYLDTPMTEISSTGAAISPAGGWNGGGSNNDGVILIDPFGNAWSGFGNLAKISPSGVALSPASTNTYIQQGFTGGGFHGTNVSSNQITGIVSDPSGNIYIRTDDNNIPNIVKFSNGGAPYYAAPGFTGGGLLDSFPNNADPGRSMAIDANGNIWAVTGSYAYQGRFSEFTPGGTALTPSTGYGSGMTGPYCLAVDGNNTLWAANGTSVYGGLYHFNTSGTNLVTSTIPGNVPSLAAPGTIFDPTDEGVTGLEDVFGMAIDGSGNVWLSASHTYMTKMVGLAAPVVTPLSVATANNVLGQRP